MPRSTRRRECFCPPSSRGHYGSTDRCRRPGQRTSAGSGKLLHSGRISRRVTRRPSARINSDSSVGSGSRRRSSFRGVAALVFWCWIRLLARRDPQSKIEIRKSRMACNLLSKLRAEVIITTERLQTNVRLDGTPAGIGRGAGQLESETAGIRIGCLADCTSLRGVLPPWKC